MQSIVVGCRLKVIEVRLQPFERGLYIDLLSLSESQIESCRMHINRLPISKRFIYSSSSLNMWSVFAQQNEAYLIWTEDDRKLLSYYRLISRYLTDEMKEERAELEMKHVIVFGEIYPPSNRVMREAHGAQDDYSLYHKMENIMDKETNLNDSQRAHLLQLYKEKLQQLGDDEFFNSFDEIREECYKQIGVSLPPSIPFYTDPVHSAASTLGRQGGKVKSESKSLSSRSNGKKGGRPKVNKSLDMEDI